MKLVIQTEDNETLALDVTPAETLVAAATRQGVTWPVDCTEGVCGTCKCRVLSGNVDLGFYTDDALTDEEVTSGYALGCQSRAQADLVIAIRTPLALLRKRAARTLVARIVRIDTVARDTTHLALALTEPLDFLPGQYAKLKVPGTSMWRSFSFTSIPGQREVAFLIRLLPQGVMSDYLRAAQAGDMIELTGPHGVFFHRPGAGRSVLIAGGTGLGPMLSMLQANLPAPAPAFTLLYGVNDLPEVACRDLLESMRQRLPDFSWSLSVVNADDGAGHRRGFATDLIDASVMNSIGTTFYLCGPPAMIDAGRAKLKAMGVVEDRIVYEKFLPSG